MKTTPTAALFRSLLLVASLAACAPLPAQQATGDWLIGVKSELGPLEGKWVTLANGQVLGKTAGQPAPVDVLTATLAAATYEPIIGAGTLALSKLATDPLARANHTGTQAWSTLTGTPTTLAGYGITDGLTAATAAATYEPIIGAGTLALSKLAQEGAVANQVLTWNGTAWVPAAAGGGALLAANNLSDVANVSTARLNLSVQPTNNPVFTGSFRAASSSSAAGANAICIGAGNQAGGANATSIGTTNVASGSNSVVLGDNNTAGLATNSTTTVIIGSGITATPAAGSGNKANALLGRNHTLSNTVNAGSTFTTGSFGTVRHSHERLHANAEFSGRSTQSGEVVLTRTTTNSATPAELFIDDATATRSFTLLAGQAYDCFIRIMGRRSDGAAHAVYWRRVLIQRTGATTSLPTAVQVIGTDFESDATWNVALTANDTNDRLAISVTGTASHTIAWTAHIIFNEISY